MKFLFPILSGCIAFAPGVSAQVSVDLALDQDQFLPGESLMVGVRINHVNWFTGSVAQARFTDHALKPEEFLKVPK